MGKLANNGNTFATDNSQGVAGITNPQNVKAVDLNYAVALLFGGQNSNLLKVTNFQFNVPDDAKVMGIKVRLLRSATLSLGALDTTVRLVKQGIIQGDNRASNEYWPLVDTYADYGSESDMWGLSLLNTDVNRSDFGVVIGVGTNLALTAQINYVGIEVYYQGSNKVQNTWNGIKVGNKMSISEKLC